jgi:DNA-binding transcriptional ArsR family regulator
MDREHLLTLHVAMGTILTWPPAVLDEIARWLAPAKPNGLDSHPPPIASPRSQPHAGKARPVATTDERLLVALRDAPGLSAVKLAAASKVHRTTVGERLRDLAGRGLVEKDDDGRWRLVEEKAARVEPGPPSPSL